VAEILIPSAETWASTLSSDEHVSSKPLLGMPISLKDTFSVAGYDQAIGYTSLIHRPAPKTSPLVQLLLDAGALPFVKSSVPTTLLSFESSSALLGLTRNPHDPKFTPGGSSGGEAALLAAGGSRIGIGTDVAGSVRLPAHWSGCYSVRGSVGRFPRYGNGTSLPGQEGVPSIVAPMARALEDLEYAWRAVVGMKPWLYDHSVCRELCYCDARLTLG
jgi:Asp-tRNA(Asn)/Glu-tRNA(Gln) amidotransferase A subunit family amidase